MSRQLDQTIHSLRESILAGRYGSQERLRENALSLDLAVSRTLVRLALSALEKEGLVESAPNRGYWVRSFTLDEVADAILVRGELEGMAARLAAENGLARVHYDRISALVVEMDGALAAGFGSLAARAEWIELNERFHTEILKASGNAALLRTIESLGQMPLVSSRAIVFDQSDPEKSLRQVTRSHEDHREVLRAIRDRAGGRAEHIMRGHALASSRNKKASFDHMLSMKQSPAIPGLALVKG